MSDKRKRMQKIRDSFRGYQDLEKDKLTDDDIKRYKKPKKKAKKKSKMLGSGSAWENLKAAFKGEDY